MAKIDFPGIEKYQKQIIQFQKKLESVLGPAVYEGAAVVADEIKAGIRALPLARGYGTAQNPLPGGATKVQKKGLMEDPASQSYRTRKDMSMSNWALMAITPPKQPNTHKGSQTNL